MKTLSSNVPKRQNYSGLLLDLNERTIPLSEKVKTAIQNFLQLDQLHLYPDCDELNQIIAVYNNLLPQNVVVTSGSDRAIEIIFRTLINPGEKVIIPTPTFPRFQHYAELANAHIVSPIYGKNSYAFPLEEVLANIDKNTKLIVICNPNNPTGTLVSLKAIKTIAQKATHSFILIDEAYFEFSGITAIELLHQFPNIIITRTFSKAFGLASLRIGYLLASPKLCEKLTFIRGCFNINSIAAIAAIASLSDLENLKRYVHEVMNFAKPLVENFFAANNITYYPSQANFILFKPEHVTHIHTQLKKRGILTKASYDLSIQDTIRLTIGTVKQMQTFIRVYQEEFLPQKYVYETHC